MQSWFVEMTPRTKEMQQSSKEICVNLGMFLKTVVSLESGRNF